MATRPVFVPIAAPPRVRELAVEFRWYPGFAVAQQQRSIASLHGAAVAHGVVTPLEISTRSTQELGRSLSAFNLRVQHPVLGEVFLESVFQGAKVFEGGVAFPDLAGRTPREAKTDPRLRASGHIIGFRFGDTEYPTHPLTAFYDWLYLQALALLNDEIRQRLCEHDGFTDIAFNPARSTNCQAHSAALFASLVWGGLTAPWSLSFGDLVAAAFGS